MVEHKITLTYLNIRQSIVILLTKLVFADIVMASVVIIFYFTLVQGERFFFFASQNTILFLVVFALAGVLKILLSVLIILFRLNEYYEITPDYIIHKQGLIFRKTQQYRLDHVRAMDVHDSFLGELFNFATLTLYDIRLNKYLDMYLIHNPQRYASVLKQLRPHIEMKKDRVRLPFMPKDELNGKEVLVYE